MGVEETPPDLVMRAMDRLGKKTPIAEPKVKPAEVAPLDAPTHEQRPETIARLATELAEKPISPPPTPQIAEISPAAMAAHGLFSLTTKSVRTVEEFRTIKRQVLNTAASKAGVHGDRSRLIMITSALPGEGKTHTALNLAFSIAEEKDRRVLLIDADVYRQSIVEYLGIKAEKGWVDHLTNDDIGLDDTIIKTNIANLSILPAGKEVPNVPELLSSRRMNSLVLEILERHPDEIIILDSLPCLVSNEPAIFSEFVGQIIFVVGAHKTAKDKVRASLSMISACPNISLILNKAEPMLTEQFGAYGYGYDYNYRKTAS